MTNQTIIDAPKDLIIDVLQNHAWDGILSDDKFADAADDIIEALSALPADVSRQMPSGYAVKHVEGHGWIIDPPHGSRWIAHEGTPAGDLMAALTAPQDAQERDVTSIKGRLRDAASNAQNRDLLLNTLDYIEALERIVARYRADAESRLDTALANNTDEKVELYFQRQGWEVLPIQTFGELGEAVRALTTAQPAEKPEDAIAELLALYREVKRSNEEGLDLGQEPLFEAEMLAIEQKLLPDLVTQAQKPEGKAEQSTIKDSLTVEVIAQAGKEQER